MTVVAEIFDFNSFPDTTMLTSGTNPTAVAATDAITANISSALLNDAAQLATTIGIVKAEVSQSLSQR